MKKYSYVFAIGFAITSASAVLLLFHFINSFLIIGLGTNTVQLSFLQRLALTTLGLFLALLVFRGGTTLLRYAVFKRKREAASSFPVVGGLLPDAMLLLSNIRQLQVLQLRTDASDVVGKMMETYKASAATVYLLDTDRSMLELFIALNAPDVPRTLDLEDQSIVKIVATSAAGYCSYDVQNDKNYFLGDKRTKSEIAVPIKSGAQVIGVLNLESSKKTHNFVTEQIPDLEKHALKLAPFLLLYGSGDTEDAASLPWYFGLHGWGLSNILGPLCAEACDYFESILQVRPSCTIWEFDHDKESFHVRATYGFDYEFRNALVLPKRSFTGQIFKMAHGKVFLDNFAKAKGAFVNHEKADFAGLTFIASTPIDLLPTASRFGVLSFYFFQPVSGVQAQDVREFAQLIGGIIAKYNALCPRVVEAHVRAELVNSPYPSHAKFEVLRELCLSVMKSEFCSIFLSDPVGQRLTCVSTTGLTRGGARIYYYRAEGIYDLRRITRGFTATVAQNPGTCLRKNESQDPTERVFKGESIMPSNHLAEAFSFGDDAHRRILVASVEDSGQLLGVIRVNRPGVRSPFIKSDEAVLLSICRAGFDVFRNAIGKALPSDDPGKFQMPGIGPVKAMMNLLEFVPVPTTTVDNFLDESFYQLLSQLRTAEGHHLHLLLRRVVNHASEEALETYYTVSTRRKRISAYTNVPRSKGGIAWKCIDTERVVSFKKSEAEGLFKSIHEFAGEVVSGINLPFSVWSMEAGRLEKWALCLDFEFEMLDVREYILLLLLIVRKLQHLLSFSSGRTDLYPAETVGQFWSRLKNGLTEFSRCGIEINSTNGGLRFVKEDSNSILDDTVNSEESSVVLPVASMRAGRAWIIGADKVILSAYAGLVFDAWNRSGVSNPCRDDAWDFGLKTSIHEGGLEFWPNIASLKSSIVFGSS